MAASKSTLLSVSWQAAIRQRYPQLLLLMSETQSRAVACICFSTSGEGCNVMEVWDWCRVLIGRMLFVATCSMVVLRRQACSEEVGNCPR